MKLRGLLAGVVFIAGCSWQDACGIRDIHDAEKAPICGNAITSSGHNEKGNRLFLAYCASCHNPLKDAVGPALRGVRIRWEYDDSALVRYIRHADKPEKARRAYIRQLREKWKSGMPGFPDLTDQQVRDILEYVHG